MKKILVYLVVMVAILPIGSCKKNGIGGDATIVVFLEHHGKNIKNHVGYPDTVFVKFKAKDAPGTKASDYDTFFVGEVGEDHVHCEGLRAGTYFLYGAGFDSSIVQRVTGGLSVKIKWSERKKEIDTHLPVTE
jgi:hypothetical protein